MFETFLENQDLIFSVLGTAGALFPPLGVAVVKLKTAIGIIDSLTTAVRKFEGEEKPLRECLGEELDKDPKQKKELKKILKKNGNEVYKKEEQ